MAEFDEGNKVESVFGGVEFGSTEASSTSGVTGGTTSSTAGGNTNSVTGGSSDGTVFKKVNSGELPTKPSVWSKIRAFLFQEIDLNAPIKIELTPYQQKVEDEINEFLHQEVSFKGFFNLFKKSNA